jgi:hypothetical protein
LGQDIIIVSKQILFVKIVTKMLYIKKICVIYWEE